jgi:hypothetical protein
MVQVIDNSFGTGIINIGSSGSAMIKSNSGSSIQYHCTIYMDDWHFKSLAVKMISSEDFAHVHEHILSDRSFVLLYNNS